MSEIKLQRVVTMPRELAPGILYVSEEFGVAGHLCACGCGHKVIVPLGPAEWTFVEKSGHPTLSPSIGNWQLPCRSHYLIIDGRIVWAGQWTEAQVLAGRAREEARREVYFASRAKDSSLWNRICNWLSRLFVG